MNTYLTPGPIVCEIRNPHGEIVIDLADVSITTVEATISDHNPTGFLDDVVRVVKGWGRPGQAEPETDPTQSPADEVHIDFRAANDPAATGSHGTLVVDAQAAARQFRSGFLIRITAPTGSSIRAQSETARVGVSGTVDKLEVKTAAGDVDVSAVTGSASVRTATGNVSMPLIGKDVDIKVVSGRVDLGKVDGRASVSGTSGAIDIDRAGGDVVIRSVSGDVTVRDTVVGTTEITAVSGSIAIGVHQGVAARVDLHTVSGRARSDLSVTGTLDGAGLTIKGRTVSGDIRLRSALAPV